MQEEVNIAEFKDLKNSIIDWDEETWHPGLESDPESSYEEDKTNEVEPENSDSEDEDFEPPICVRNGANLKTKIEMHQIPTISLEDTVHDILENQEESPHIEISAVPEPLKVEVEDLIGHSASITYQSSLKQLVDYLILPVSHCLAKNHQTKKECMASKPFDIQINSRGEAFVIEWVSISLFYNSLRNIMQYF
ncbi:uncharacterized protein [Nothobranchius furzeri]|uniref:uncharacterized protein n=1 Tax=Nothobranchius furzeri TaxID=105023 RepID=UPI003904CE75